MLKRMNDFILKVPTWLLVVSLLLVAAFQIFLIPAFEDAHGSYEGTFELTQSSVVFAENEGDGELIFLGTPNCPHCRSFFETTFQDVMTEFDGRVVYQNVLSSSTIQRDGVIITMLACLPEREDRQGLISRVYSEEAQDLSADELADLMTAGSLREKFQDCTSREDVLEKTKASLDEVTKLMWEYKVVGTPTILVNGKKYTGEIPYEDLLKKKEDE